MISAGHCDLSQGFVWVCMGRHTHNHPSGSHLFRIDYIRNELANTYARGNTIIRHFKHCSEDVKVKLILYNSYCCNIHCCALVSAYHKTVLDKFPVACNKVFKSLMGVPWDFSAYALFVSLNVCNFVTLRRKLVYSFLKRIRSSSNTLICTLFNSVHFEKCNLKKEWDNVLLIWVEYSDNEVCVYSVYNKLFYGLCLIIKLILSYLILWSQQLNLISLQHFVSPPDTHHRLWLPYLGD